MRSPSLRRAAHSRGPDGERGSATLNLVVVFPVFLLLLLATVQAALVWHAQNVARSAAEQGLQAERLYDGTAPAGRARATQFLTETAGTLVADTAVSTSRTATVARIEVRGTALALIPGLHLAVHADISAPVERFTPDVPALGGSPAPTAGSGGG
jgi:Flp pilus assembly protein TadG